MAIFHLSHGYVGKRTQKQPHTAAAHSNYITRPSTATVVMGERMPTDWRAAAAWLKVQEDDDRINARVIDKIEVALPVELTPVQRAALVRDFAETLTQGRASWLAAFHDGPKDEHNPHAHIILRDRDATPGPGQGRRVMLTTERGTIDRIRELWQEKANQALERAGSTARIDHRTLAAQGIEREPQIHIGSTTLALAEKGVTPESRPAEVQRIDFTTGRLVTVTVDYPALDQGRTRAEHNAAIIARNAVPAGPIMVVIPDQPAPGAGAIKAADEVERRRAGSQAPELPDWTDRGGMVQQQRAANAWVRSAAQVEAGRQGDQAHMFGKNPFGTGALPVTPKVEPSPAVLAAEAKRSTIAQYGHPQGMGEGPDWTVTRASDLKQDEQAQHQARQDVVRDELTERGTASQKLTETQRANHRQALEEPPQPARQPASNPFTRGVTEKNLADLAAARRGQERGLER